MLRWLLLLLWRNWANCQPVILVVGQRIGSARSRQRIGCPFIEQTRPEDAAKRLPELTAHDAIKDEIDGAVDERQDVCQLAQVTVAVGEESVSQDAAEKSQNALREFRHEEQNQNG